jgi:hypothetical protein
MPAVTVPKNALATGPGYLYIGAVGVTLPTNTVSGSVFTDSWPGGWSLLGITKEGHTFNYSIDTDKIIAAEYFDPLQIVTTGRAASVTFELMQISATSFSKALNGGVLTPSGSGTTQLNTYTPPVPGAEVRCAIGWESQDNTERLVFEQAFQTGTLQVSRKKGADNATIPVEFASELPASGFPFRYWTAGTIRA